MPTPILPTRLTQRYGVDHPFAAAGMAFVGTTPELAIAVCRAGGIGSIGVGPLPAEAIRGLVRGVRKATDRPLNVNFITFLAREEQMRVCVEERVPIVSFHWGHPSPEFLKTLRSGNVSVWEQVGSVADAKRAAEDGIDLVIAQGSEAGGHNRGTLPAFVLTPSVVEAVAPTLVLAAGGITTGSQVAAALALGADGVWVGSRLVASAEANAHPEYKRRLVESDGSRTCLSSIFGRESPHFNPMRVIANRVVTEFSGKEESLPSNMESEPLIGRTNLLGHEMPLHRFSSSVPMPATEGDLEEMPLLAGQGIGLIHEILPAGEIVRGMIADAAAILSRLASTWHG